MEVEYLFGISHGTWSIIFAGLSAIVVVVTLPAVLYNLRVISRTHNLESFAVFLDELVTSENERIFLYKKFPRKEDYSDLDDESKEKIKSVINTLNRIGMLVENKVVSSASVFGLCHTVIIRCSYKLELYMAYKEKQLGGRYGRRILRLAERAKKFHDALPHQRKNVIKIFDNKESIVIHKTNRKTGIKGVIQLINWKIIQTFDQY